MIRHRVKEGNWDCKFGMFPGIPKSIHLVPEYYQMQKISEVKDDRDLHKQTLKFMSENREELKGLKAAVEELKGSGRNEESEFTHDLKEMQKSLDEIKKNIEDMKDSEKNLKELKDLM